MSPEDDFSGESSSPLLRNDWKQKEFHGAEQLRFSGEPLKFVDIVDENFDVAIRAHSAPLPNPTLVQRTQAPLLLFAGAACIDANGPIERPHDLAKRPSLFMMRTDVSPIWRFDVRAVIGRKPS
jgi:DNA-binding transcriptional LysR family regulator